MNMLRPFVGTGADRKKILEKHDDRRGHDAGNQEGKPLLGTVRDIVKHFIEGIDDSAHQLGKLTDHGVEDCDRGRGENREHKDRDRDLGTYFDELSGE